MKQRPAHAAGTPATPATPASETADALLRAGRKLFTLRGYDGASVRALTAEAGVNLGAVTYHFGSKRGLHDAVLASCFDPFAARIESTVLGSGGPLDRAEAVVRAYFEFLSNNPELPHLLLQELAVGGMPPAGALKPMRRILAALQRLIEEGQRGGSIRAGDPLLMGLSIVSQPVHFSIMRRVLESMGVLGRGGGARLTDHVVRFVRAGLTAAAEVPA